MGWFYSYPWFLPTFQAYVLVWVMLVCWQCLVLVCFLPSFYVVFLLFVPMLVTLLLWPDPSCPSLLVSVHGWNVFSLLSLVRGLALTLQSFACALPSLRVVCLWPVLFLQPLSRVFLVRTGIWLRQIFSFVSFACGVSTYLCIAVLFVLPFPRSLSFVTWPVLSHLWLLSCGCNDQIVARTSLGDV